MWNKAFVGAAVLMIVGSMIVYAQERVERPDASVEDKDAVADRKSVV